MPTRETDLPGVGKKYSFGLSSGDELVVVEHRAGDVEIARLDAEGGPTLQLRLGPREAGELGRILSRASESEEDSRKNLLFRELSIEWLELAPGAPLIGESLLESGIRRATGVNVIAILRPDGAIGNPPPETRLQEGDTLVVMGQRDQVKSFMEAYAALPPEPPSS